MACGQRPYRNVRMCPTSPFCAKELLTLPWRYPMGARVRECGHTRYQKVLDEWGEVPLSPKGDCGNIVPSNDVETEKPGALYPFHIHPWVRTQNSHKLWQFVLLFFYFILWLKIRVILVAFVGAFSKRFSGSFSLHDEYRKGTACHMPEQTVWEPQHGKDGLISTLFKGKFTLTLEQLQHLLF